MLIYLFRQYLQVMHSLIDLDKLHACNNKAYGNKHVNKM